MLIHLVFLVLPSRHYAGVNCFRHMQRMAIYSGILSAGLAVILGAFGAHSLKEKLDGAQLQVFETAVRYQMYHAFALLILGFADDRLNARLADRQRLVVPCRYHPVQRIALPDLLPAACWYRTLEIPGSCHTAGRTLLHHGWVLFLLAYTKNQRYEKNHFVLHCIACIVHRIQKCQPDTRCCGDKPAKSQ
jgi:hypothetical protein